MIGLLLNGKNEIMCSDNCRGEEMMILVLKFGRGGAGILYCSGVPMDPVRRQKPQR